jgi:hypothetical protein
MRQLVLHSKSVATGQTPECVVYCVFFLGLMHSLGVKGWEVTAEAQAGDGYVDLRLVHKQKREAVLIELKSSENTAEMWNGDAETALEQITDKNYRNPEGLPNIEKLREYGIAFYRLDSCVEGQYLVLDQHQWVEKEDPVIGD